MIKIFIFSLVLFFISAIGYCSGIYNPGTGNGNSCGLNPVGIMFTDSNLCTWCVTINTSGVISTTLISCPDILQEDGTYILQEDGSKITLE